MQNDERKMSCLGLMNKSSYLAVSDMHVRLGSLSDNSWFPELLSSLLKDLNVQSITTISYIYIGP